MRRHGTQRGPPHDDFLQPRPQVGSPALLHLCGSVEAIGRIQPRLPLESQCPEFGVGVSGHRPWAQQPTEGYLGNCGG